MGTQSLALLVVDDDGDFRESLLALVARDGHEVHGADCLSRARTLLRERSFDALLVDQELPDGNGLELVHFETDGVQPEFVMITGHATVETAVKAVKQGVADYLTKPLDPARLSSTLANIAKARGLKRELAQLRQELRGRAVFSAFPGQSAVMQPVYERVKKVAATDASVLIEGESGTGKEVLAHMIHSLSPRRDGPFLALNCGAIPEMLIESELFGHEKGSFTGADRQHKGFFERANGGTLLLDEITEMPAQLQVKLLRVLETGQVQRVGSSATMATDVRVLSATNRDPEEAIRQGKLREDLYFRLAVFPLTLPPLRERTGDIELFAQHFLDRLNAAHGTHKRWDAEALAALVERPWKGNVRELKNAVQRAFILADDVLGAEHAAPREPETRVDPNAGVTIRVGSSIADAERELIIATLTSAAGDKTTAAAILGISLKTLYNRLNIYAAKDA